MDLGEPFFSDPELSGGTRNDQCKKNDCESRNVPIGQYWYPMRTFTGYFGTSHYNLKNLEGCPGPMVEHRRGMDP